MEYEAKKTFIKFFSSLKERKKENQSIWFNCSHGAELKKLVN
jgi:hypothetical protein